MTVQELIDELNKFSQDADAIYDALNDNDCYYEQDVVFISDRNGKVVINDGL